jgi:cobalt-zinc-cadmium resistance protein CzcA
MALYGLNAGDLNKVIRTGFAGETAGTVYEGEQRYDLVVRLDKDFRQDISNVKNIFVSLPSGNQVPLDQVADVSFEQGPAQISREDGRRRTVIGLNVRGRDVKSVVTDIQEKLNAKLKLPDGYYVTYGGQFENLVQANKRLSVAVPIALLLIFVLLFFTFGSIKQSILIFTAIPLSAIGGVLALWLRGMPFSISAGIGFIALFGVAVLNGIVLIGYFNQLKKEGISNIMERIKTGTTVRLRPVLMTAAVASLGFLPMALSNGSGAEVQKPLATVVIGGLLTATLLTLIVLPILYYLFENGVKRKLKKMKPIITTVVLLLLFFAPRAQNSTSLSLPQAIEMATKNNGLITIGELSTKLQNQLKGTANDLPKTNFTVMLGQYNTRQIDQNYSISQSFSPFLVNAKKQLLTENTKSSELNAVVTRQEIVYRLRQSWNHSMYLAAFIKELYRQDSLLKGFVKSAALKHKTGDGNLVEKLTAETRQQELQQIIKQNEAALMNEKFKIQALLNNTDGFEIAEKDFVPFANTIVPDSTQINKNPQLMAALQQLNTASAVKKTEQAYLKPDFTLGYFVQSLTGNQEVNNQIKYYNGTPRFMGITLGMAVPLFGKAQKAKISAAQTNIDIQKQQAGYLQKQLQSQLLQQANNLLTLRQLLNYYTQTALPNAHTIVTKISRGYQSGDIGYVEYLQGMQTASDIQKNYLQAISNYNQAYISINYLLNN